MTPPSDRRFTTDSDRRRMPRGGRRTSDRPGRFPVLLVADAYEGARQSFVRYLTRFGFRVEEAGTTAQALALLDTVRPHVMLADLTLPGASALLQGTGAAAPGGVPVPIIGLLTWEGSRTPPEVAGVLVKPFRLRVMLDEVRQVLRAL